MSAQSARTAALYLAMVFVAGSVFGFAANEFYRAKAAEARTESPSSANEYRKRLLESLDADLNLDDDQVSDIMLILDDIGESWHRLRDAMEPEFEALRQERAERIMEVLSPTQRAKYEQILDERRRRRDEGGD